MGLCALVVLIHLVLGVIRLLNETWFDPGWRRRERAEAEQVHDPAGRPSENSDAIQADRASGYFSHVCSWESGVRPWEGQPMAAQVARPSCSLAWCLGGFLFPAAIMAIGLAFQRGFPPTEAELARAAVHPTLLSHAINGLALSHVAAAALAVALWHDRQWVRVVTAAQLGCTLYAWFLSAMAVQGTWL
jgi:hypothetical protein